MTKEMNKMNSIIVKYDIMVCLFLSLFIGIFSSFVLTVAFAVGFLVSVVNYLLLSYFVHKWLTKSKLIVIISSIMRILIVVAVMVLFINDYKKVIMYILGFSLHYAVLVYCTITRKGSA